MCCRNKEKAEGTSAGSIMALPICACTYLRALLDEQGRYIEIRYNVAHASCLFACSLYTVHFLQTAQVDDVVDAFAVHGVGGLWGLVAVGFVSTQANYQVTVRLSK